MQSILGLISRAQIEAGKGKQTQKKNDVRLEIYAVAIA
jgi:hypothetical protein